MDSRQGIVASRLMAGRFFYRGNFHLDPPGNELPLQDIIFAVHSNGCSVEPAKRSMVLHKVAVDGACLHPLSGYKAGDDGVKLLPQ